MNKWNLKLMNDMQLIETENSLKTLLPFSVNKEATEIKNKLIEVTVELEARRVKNQKLVIEMIG